MTKAEIVQALYAKVGGFSKKESADIVDLVFEMLKETLGKGEKIKISGFGNFVLRDKRQRPGRNPQTGDPIKISERRVLTFKASQILKHALNPRPSGGATLGSTSSSAPRAGDHSPHPSRPPQGGDSRGMTGGSNGAPGVSPSPQAHASTSEAASPTTDGPQTSSKS
jgi:integration host factor subunit alpha